MKRSSFCVTVFKTTIYISISMWLLVSESESESGESSLVASRTTTGELVACISTVKNNIQTKITTGFFRRFFCYDSRMVFKMILFITVWMSRNNNALKCMYLTAATAYRTILPMMWFLLIHFFYCGDVFSWILQPYLFLGKCLVLTRRKQATSEMIGKHFFFQFFLSLQVN